MQKLTHDEIQNMLLFIDPDYGNLVCGDINDHNNTEKHRVIFGPGYQVLPKFYNLLSASALMYQTLSVHIMYIQLQISLFEEFPKSDQRDHIVSSLNVMQNACLTAQLVAQNGADSVTSCIDKDGRLI
jgi:hypothetical protein